MMADCPSLPKCVFFNDRMSKSPATAEAMKNRLCQGDNSQCARWMVASAKGGAAVPGDLYPNEKDRVAALIAN